MGNDEWKKRLKDCFEGIRVLERCRKETRDNFRQFCEFIAEPAFESLAGELKEYGVRAGFRMSGEESIVFVTRFPDSRAEQFHYILGLPGNYVELRMNIRLRWRKSKAGVFAESVEPFMSDVPPEQILKLAQEELILDVIERYGRLSYQSLVSPE